VDEASVEQKYYIATESSPSDDRTRVLKYGKMFAIFNRYGDIETSGLNEQGIFFEGTRFLSRLELTVGGAKPLLLSSTVKQDNSIFAADLANVDLSRNGTLVIPRGTLHLVRRQFLWQDACYQKFELFNYGLSPVDLAIRIAFAADFADIFEVRGMQREKRGKLLSPVVEASTVVLEYDGLDGISRRTCLHADPAPAKADHRSFEFDGQLEARGKKTFTLTVVCQSDGRPRPHIFDTAWSNAESAHHAEYRISSSNPEFNDWVQRSQSDVQTMTIGNPESHYPYAGVPWFSTVFGRDGIITAMQYLWLDPELGRGVLKYLAETQARECSAQSEAEPGKILHEMRRGEMANLGEVPFAHYYGSVDATPLFIMLADAYYQRTGDCGFVEGIWDNIQRALYWMDEYGDCDHDGFVEYSRRTDKGLLHQGWKDSNDSIFHADGSAAAPPIALCEVQGYVYAAKQGAARLSRVLGDEKYADMLDAQAGELRSRFNQAFWCPGLSTYAIALDGDKRPCQVKTSNAGQCLFTGIADEAKAHQLAHLLVGHEFFSGWGIRTVACGESRYNPISYHNGSIWPHDNAIIAAGLARYGFKHLAAQILWAMLDASRFLDLQRMPELFCGLDRRAGEGPTLYPVACAPQAWAAGSVFMMLQACLGLSFDAGRGQIRLDSPYLPEVIPQLWIRDLRLGKGRVSFYAERKEQGVQVQILEQQDVKLLVT
jgi:glycogen debranching enzyme